MKRTIEINKLFSSVSVLFSFVSERKNRWKVRIVFVVQSHEFESKPRHIMWSEKSENLTINFVDDFCYSE